MQKLKEIVDNLSDDELLLIYTIRVFRDCKDVQFKKSWRFKPKDEKFNKFLQLFKYSDGVIINKRSFKIGSAIIEKEWVIGIYRMKEVKL